MRRERQNLEEAEKKLFLSLRCEVRKLNKEDFESGDYTEDEPNGNKEEIIFVYLDEDPSIERIGCTKTMRH